MTLKPDYIELPGVWPWRKVRFYGGPYPRKPDHMYGVCAAGELIGHVEAKLFLNTFDFRSPTAAQLVMVGMESYRAALLGHTVYVGCGAGQGRTGTVLAAIAQIGGVEDGVKFVRDNYRPEGRQNAKIVETREQEITIQGMDAAHARAVLRSWIWRRRFGMKPMPYRSLWDEPIEGVELQ